MAGNEQILILFLVYVLWLGQLFDCFTTALGLEFGGKEANPIGRLVFNLAGLGWGITITCTMKMLFVFAVCLIGDVSIMVTCDVVIWLVVANNVNVIRKMIRDIRSTSGIPEANLDTVS